MNQSLHLPLPDDEKTTLQSALRSTLDLDDSVGGFFVVAVEPGGGKSTVLRAELATRAIAEGTRPILWVVKETLNAESLGEQTRQHFSEQGVPVRVLRGRDHFKGRGKTRAYAEQFEWSGTSEVKIISQKHLAAMLCADEGTLLHECLRTAHTVVLDEDPLDGLILPGKGWSLSELSRVSSPGRIVKALLALEAGGAWRAEAELTETKRKQTTHRWTNRSFWAALKGELGALTPHDLEQFQTDLLAASRATAKLDDIEGSLSRGAVREVVKAFNHDYHLDDPVSQRFNLRWNNGEQGAFNAFVLAPWPRAGTAIVLDAYATPDLYERLLGGPIVMRKAPQDKELQLRSAPALALNELNIVAGHQHQHLLYVLQEIREHQKRRGGRKVLIVVSKQVRESPNFRKAFQAVFAGSADVAVQHWQSSRGSNSYVGCDIFALTEPHINTAAREETLAAVAPTDPTLRQELYRHLQVTELLQMLHRSRQIHNPHDPSDIVVSWPLKGAARYEMILPPTKGAHNKLWLTLVQDLIMESLQRLGGFCYDFLLGSCLLTDSVPDQKISPQIKAWLGSLPPESVLRQVLLEGSLPPGIQPVAKETAKKTHLPTIIKHLGLQLHEIAASPYDLGGAQQRQVFLPDDYPGAEVAAVRLYERFVPPGKRTLKPSLEDII
ncbi:hypothetical protein [Deinococcus soli (ex Cha et al. 2016)]|uniref:Uncharacterized protein n=2 Tax=Deinococcus soli (ex Cha et al. 2016) TaxID=1309411 RepID=A0AAE3XFK9_9DEIO|nr:hypothetical protein [Deinococcus soli (ex Cha et al. 2016)]MDR6219848.1 hypothetical protein [Deinococcus soli (ex Cha et al. 2016)]MDR6329894.1 hypothetical protein [Deinococcus soli (ex Cha et al. 2016)]MDR6752755.1 hypothetical protein [Deinococcus soli (ex Cha et al. 2016)]